jgi:hypothetical protein
MENAVKVLKWVAILLIVVTGGLILYKLYKLIEPILSGDAFKNDSGTEHAEIPVNETDKKFFVHSESQLKQVAELLFNAMADFGTDEVAIIKAVDTLNDREFEFVYNYFGKRRYFAGTRSAMLGEELTLAEWLKAELSAKSYQSIVKRFDSSKITFP